MNEKHAIITRIKADLSLLQRLIDVPEELPERESAPPPEAWLAPCQLADRLGIGEAYARKLIGRGIKLDLPGFEKRGGRLFATVDAVKELRET